MLCRQLLVCGLVHRPPRIQFDSLAQYSRWNVMYLQPRFLPCSDIIITNNCQLRPSLEHISYLPASAHRSAHIGNPKIKWQQQNYIVIITNNTGPKFRQRPNEITVHWRSQAIKQTTHIFFQHFYNKHEKKEPISHSIQIVHSKIIVVIFSNKKTDYEMNHDADTDLRVVCVCVTLHLMLFLYQSLNFFVFLSSSLSFLDTF